MRQPATGANIPSNQDPATKFDVRGQETAEPWAELADGGVPGAPAAKLFLDGPRKGRLFLGTEEAEYTTWENAVAACEGIVPARKSRAEHHLKTLAREALTPPRVAEYGSGTTVVKFVRQVEKLTGVRLLGQSDVPAKTGTGRAGPKVQQVWSIDAVREALSAPAQ